MMFGFNIARFFNAKGTKDDNKDTPQQTSGNVEQTPPENSSDREVQSNPKETEENQVVLEATPGEASPRSADEISSLGFDECKIDTPTAPTTVKTQSGDTAIDVSPLVDTETESQEVSDVTFHLPELTIHGSALEEKSSPYLVQDDSFSVGSWNLLASGLEIDGFLTVRGLPDVQWSSRRSGVAAILSNMLRVNDVVVTQENDNFFYLLDRLQQNPNIKGVWCSKSLPPKDRESIGSTVASNARSFLIKRMAQQLLTEGLMTEQSAEKVRELLALKPKEFAPRCSELYSLVNATNTTPGSKRFTTFSEVSQTHVSFSEFYGLGPDDTFISDDGIGIYYDSSKVSLVSTGDALFAALSPEKCSTYGMVGQTPVLWNKDGWVDLTFQLKNSGRTVKVYGAHLPSGEDAEAEKDRCKVMKVMIESIPTGNAIPVVFAMDSNVSPEYEAGFGDATLMSSLYKLAGFEDSIPAGTFPCFKMRGPGSDQPKKIGELFVDQIDKILYQPRFMSVVNKERPLNEYGFKRLSRRAYEEVYPIRTTKELRDQNNTKVRQGGRESVVRDIYPEEASPFLEIYPGPESPSDHPPISTEFLFTYQRSEPTPPIERDATPEPVKECVSITEEVAMSITEEVAMSITEDVAMSITEEVAMSITEDVAV